MITFLIVLAVVRRWPQLSTAITTFRKRTLLQIIYG